MQLKIGNILAGFILMFTLWFFLEYQADVLDCLACIMRMGPEYPTSDKLRGCIALALIILGIVSAIRLISSERHS